MKYLLISLLSTFLIACPAKKNERVYKSFTYEASSGLKLPYRVLFPDNYDKSNHYPLLLFLHGAGERGNDNEKQLVHIASKFTSDEYQEKHPSIIIFPQCPENDYWAHVNRDDGKWLVEDTDKATPSMEAVMEMLNDFKRTEAVDKSRMYVTGLSMGGFGTYDLLSRRPNWFAAAIPICGGGNKRYSYKYSHVPIWLFHGAKDPVVPVTLSRELADDFRGRSMRVRYTEYPEGGHDVWTQAWNEEKLLPWLFSHSIITED